MKRKRYYSKMHPTKLEALTSDLNDQDLLSRSTPLTPAQAEVWKRIRRRLGRRRMG